MWEAFLSLEFRLPAILHCGGGFGVFVVCFPSSEEAAARPVLPAAGSSPSRAAQGPVSTGRLEFPRIARLYTVRADHGLAGRN